MLLKCSEKEKEYILAGLDLLIYHFKLEFPHEKETDKEKFVRKLIDKITKNV